MLPACQSQIINEDNQHTLPHDDFGISITNTYNKELPAPGYLHLTPLQLNHTGLKRQYRKRLVMCYGCSTLMPDINGMLNRFSTPMDKPVTGFSYWVFGYERELDKD